MDEASGKDLHQHDTHFPKESQQPRRFQLELIVHADTSQIMRFWEGTSDACFHGWTLYEDAPRDFGVYPDYNGALCGKCGRTVRVHRDLNLREWLPTASEAGVL